MELIVTWLTEKVTGNKDISRAMVAAGLLLCMVLAWWWALAMNRQESDLYIGTEEEQLSLEEL